MHTGLICLEAKQTLFLSQVFKASVLSNALYLNLLYITAHWNYHEEKRMKRTKDANMKHRKN